MKRLVASALSLFVATSVIPGAASRATAQGTSPPARVAAPRTALPDEVVAPGADLVIDGIPPVPASLAREVLRYSGAYGLPLAGWNPAKREVWLKGLTSSATYLSRVEAPGGQPQNFIYVPQGLAYDVYLQPQARRFVFNVDNAGDERFRFYLYDLASKQVSALTEGRSRDTEPVWSCAGDRIVYSSAQPDAEGVSLYVMDPLAPSGKRLFVRSTGGYLKAYDWSPDDRRIVYADFSSNAASRLWSADAASGKTALLTPGESEAYYDEARFSRDAKGLYVLTDRDSDTRRVAYLSLGSGDFKYLTTGKWDVETFAVAPDERTIAFVRNEDGVSRLYLLDLAKGTETRADGIPAGVISDLTWHANSLDLAFNLRSPRAPRDVYVFNKQSGRAERWARSANGQIDLDKLAEPELIRWKSFDEREISGFLYRPPATFAGKRPVVIDIHGGPQEQYRPEFSYEHNYLLNELGVAVIYPNVRGSNGFGKAFARLDDKLNREDSVRDIGALLDWIKTRPDLDAERVMVQGASYGGYMALSVAVKYSDRIRCAVSEYGISNLATAMDTNEGYDRLIQRAEFGDERDPKAREFLERISPLRNVNRINTPLLVIHGAQDTRVKVGEAESIVRAVKQRGVPVWFLLARNEGHGFTGQSSFAYRLYAKALFAKQFLLK